MKNSDEEAGIKPGDIVMVTQFGKPYRICVVVGGKVLKKTEKKGYVVRYGNHECWVEEKYILPAEREGENV